MKYATIKVSREDVALAAAAGASEFARLKFAEVQAAIFEMLETQHIEMQDGYHLYPQPESFYHYDY